MIRYRKDRVQDILGLRLFRDLLGVSAPNSMVQLSLWTRCINTSKEGGISRVSQKDLLRYHGDLGRITLLSLGRLEFQA